MLIMRMKIGNPNNDPVERSKKKKVKGWVSLFLHHHPQSQSVLVITLSPHVVATSISLKKSVYLFLLFFFEKESDLGIAFRLPKCMLFLPSRPFRSCEALILCP